MNITPKSRITPLVLTILLFLIIITGCASIQSETRINSTLQVREFNSISSKYVARPTFVTFYELNNGDKSLYVESNSYRPNHSNSLNFGVKYVDVYISFIDKYLEWEKIASKRNDSLTKDIGTTKSWADALNLTFSFYSGNSNNHYLVIAGCGLICVENSPYQYYDKNSAIELRSLLIKLKDNQLNVIDDSFYK
ncbi:hypothetical protein F7U67_002061 [Vibrio metschnikovii]|nr:hypothetical protein [Vibrio metschnikovii]ELF5343856.1 hypothetical protein [Vibrio metschnikovii]